MAAQIRNGKVADKKKKVRGNTVGKSVTGKRVAGLENPAFSLNGNHAYEKA